MLHLGSGRLQEALECGLEDGFEFAEMVFHALVSQVHARVCITTCPCVTGPRARVCMCVFVCVCVWWVCMSVCVWELFWVKTTFIEATTARGCCVRGC